MSDSSHASARDEFQMLWSTLPVPAPVTADQVRRRARDLAAWERRRAIGMAVIFAAGVGQTAAVFLFRTWPLALWEWAGLAYLVAIAIALLWITLAGRGRPHSTTDGMECVRMHRSLLEQERDANQGQKLAVRALLVFGLLGHSAFVAVTYAPAMVLPIALGAVVAGSVIWRRGLARARLLQMHIDAVGRD
jgi:hypothetical protein